MPQVFLLPPYTVMHYYPGRLCILEHPYLLSRHIPGWAIQKLVSWYKASTLPQHSYMYFRYFEWKNMHTSYRIAIGSLHRTQSRLRAKVCTL